MDSSTYTSDLTVLITKTRTRAEDLPSLGRSSSHVHDDNLIFCERSEQSNTQTMEGERGEEGRRGRKRKEGE